MLILFSAKERAEVVVQPSAAIVAFVYDDGVLGAVLCTEQFAVDGAEAVAVHLPDVDVGDSSVREAVYHGAVAVYPASVEQVFLLTLGNGFDGNVEPLLGLGVEDRHADGLACLSVEQIVVVLVLEDGLAVNLLYDAAAHDVGFLHCERAALDDLFHLQAVAS